MPEKKKYTHYVSIPFAGTIYSSIESDRESMTPREIVAAWFDREIKTKTEWELESGDAIDYEILSHIVEGNCCSAPTWEAAINETEENE